MFDRRHSHWDRLDLWLFDGGWLPSDWSDYCLDRADNRSLWLRFIIAIDIGLRLENCQEIAKSHNCCFSGKVSEQGTDAFLDECDHFVLGCDLLFSQRKVTLFEELSVDLMESQGEVLFDLMVGLLGNP